MNKQIAILTHSSNTIENALKDFYSEIPVDIIVTNSPLEAIEADLCIVDEFDGYINTNILSESLFIKAHSSLLPAFNCEKPIEKAFKEGVKVSGITICYLNNDGTNGKIIAQYPLFIDLSTTIEDFKQEIFKAKEKLIPFVSKSILEDKIFDFGMLLKENHCGNNCNNCKK